MLIPVALYMFSDVVVIRSGEPTMLLLVLDLVLSRMAHRWPGRAPLNRAELVCGEGEIDSNWIGHTGFGVDSISNLLPISDGRPPLSKANQILLMIPFPLPHY